MKGIKGILDEMQKNFHCRSNEECGASHGSKECLKCEQYCISYIDLYNIICELEEVKKK